MQADVTVGEVPGSGGLRGVLAARSFKQGEVVISLPTKLAIGLGLHNFTPQVPCCTCRHQRPQCSAPVLPCWCYGNVTSGQ